MSVLALQNKISNNGEINTFHDYFIKIQRSNLFYDAYVLKKLVRFNRLYRKESFLSTTTGQLRKQKLAPIKVLQSIVETSITNRRRVPAFRVRGRLQRAICSRYVQHRFVQLVLFQFNLYRFQCRLSLPLLYLEMGRKQLDKGKNPSFLFNRIVKLF